MSEVRKRLPSPAFVLAALALFTALAGVGYAGTKSKSVKGKHIKRHAVQKRHLAKGAVTSAAVADSSLRSEDLAADAVTPQFAGYLQPRSATKTIDVGWSTTSPASPSLIEYVTAGRYRFTFTRDDGLGCAIPTATALNNNDVSFRVVGLGCNQQGSGFTLATSSDQDSGFLLQVAFSG